MGELLSSYKQALCDAMTMLAQDKRTVFMGQAVAFRGTGMTETFAGVPRDQLLELPVFEDTQIGLAIGMSLDGAFPICIIPRINFLLCGINQLVNHLDKMRFYSKDCFKPKVIIRTAVGAVEPLHPGAQHIGDYSYALGEMLHAVEVTRLANAAQVRDAYEIAMKADRSTILVEHAGLY